MHERSGTGPARKAPLLCHHVELAQQLAAPNNIVNSPVEHITDTRSSLFDSHHMATVRVWRSKEVERNIAK